MALNPKFLDLSARARPKILRLAREKMLVETAFVTFAAHVYPLAGPAQLKELRIAFFAGACELLQLQSFGWETESGSDEPSDGDLQLMTDIAEEIEGFHAKTLAEYLPTRGRA